MYFRPSNLPVDRIKGEKDNKYNKMARDVEGIGEREGSRELKVACRCRLAPVPDINSVNLLIVMLHLKKDNGETNGAQGVQIKSYRTIPQPCYSATTVTYHTVLCDFFFNILFYTFASHPPTRIHPDSHWTFLSLL